MGVTAQWLKFSLNKFRKRFQIREIRKIKDPRNISAIQYAVYSGLLNLGAYFRWGKTRVHSTGCSSSEGGSPTAWAPRHSTTRS